MSVSVLLLFGYYNYEYMMSVYVNKMLRGHACRIMVDETMAIR